MTHTFSLASMAVRRCGLLGLCIAMFAGLFLPADLAARQGTAIKENKHPTLKVVATVFPIHLFTRNIAHSRPYVQIDLLIPPSSGCPHNYSPSPQDLQKLAQADVIIINGLGLEGFLQKNLTTLPADTLIVDASHGISPLTQQQERAGHEHMGCEHDTGKPYNPHIFAGPRQAASMAYTIAAGLAKADPRAAAAYQRAAEEYAARLLSLDRRLAEIGLAAQQKEVVLQHNALAYLAANAGLKVLDVIQTDAEASPSPARMLELTRRIGEHRPALILTEPQFPDRLAQILARETQVPLLSLDPLASGPTDAPLSYYEAVMATNCNLLERSLVQY